MTIARSTVSVLVERVGDWWVAQCLEHDIATQARSLADLHDELARMLTAHFASSEELGADPFDAPPAPPEAWAKFEIAATSATARALARFDAGTLQRVPDVVVRIAD